MKLRPPAVPLITIDPYFSVWSFSDQLNADETKHWTGKSYQLNGFAEIDGKNYQFMGRAKDEETTMQQKELTITALSSEYIFTCAAITLKATFTSPLLLEDLALCSRPVSYLALSVSSNDGENHNVKVSITADDQLCVNFKGEFPTEYKEVALNEIVCGKVGSTIQKPLNKCGDDLRINWGYLFLATNCNQGEITAIPSKDEYETPVYELKITACLDTSTNQNGLFAFAYDDIKSIEYFGKQLTSYWNKDGETIETAIEKAFAEYDSIKERCDAFAAKLHADAVASGSEKYAQILDLAYRQAIAGHKIAVDEDGSVLFISKENFSNGCAATVDVTYPSTPLFLLYNPELVKGMLRPIFKYANQPEWFFKFAPHDAGTYPLVNGQVYSNGTCPQWQMPVEECGNMLVAAAAAALVENDASFAAENWDTLNTWCQYLIKEGLDPQNQLCTDDFAGHLAHNCNLSIKAIMGIAAFSILCQMRGKIEEADQLKKTSKEMAEKWICMAKNDDGTYRLAFDRPETFSMKYNAIWDQLFQTDIFPKGCFDKEISSYVKEHLNQYGMPLDNRADYTKSDWLVWSAALSENKEDFTALTDSLWNAYNDSVSRVPLTDWYDTKTAKMIGFQNRTVQGGLFIKLLKDKGLCK